MLGSAFIRLLNLRLWPMLAASQVRIILAAALTGLPIIKEDVPAVSLIAGITLSGHSILQTLSLTATGPNVASAANSLSVLVDCRGNG